MSTPESSSSSKIVIVVALIGLIGVLGGALIANWGNIFGRDGATPPSTATSMPTSTATANVTPTPTATPTPCVIAGTVYNFDDRSTLHDVEISYYPAKRPDNNSKPTYLAATAPDGAFYRTCPDIPVASFPLTLVLTRQDWRGVEVTAKDPIPAGGLTGVPLYASLKAIQDQGNVNVNARTRLYAVRAINPAFVQGIQKVPSKGATSVHAITQIPPKP